MYDDIFIKSDVLCLTLKVLQSADTGVLSTLDYINCNHLL